MTKKRKKAKTEQNSFQFWLEEFSFFSFLISIFLNISVAVPPYTVAVSPPENSAQSAGHVAFIHKSESFLFKSFCLDLRLRYPLALKDESSEPPQPPPFLPDTYSNFVGFVHTCASHPTRSFSCGVRIPIPGAVGI
ncbi:unnamed protein product [Citrullus colocynthis]|uniref:Uncharacterized protein n=1 Tax=Citrullus colocynthis TaxID=252529 RepID=A0ABP0ZEQ6_9ROSI